MVLKKGKSANFKWLKNTHWRSEEKKKKNLIQVTLQHSTLTLYPLAKEKRAINNYLTIDISSVFDTNIS